MSISTAIPRERGEEANEATDFLVALQDFVQRGEEDDAMRLIYQKMYRLRQEGRLDVCDHILSEVAIEAFSPVLLVAFLTVTAPIKARLENRVAFYRQVCESILRERGQEKTERLLVGLE